jgi:hypothetical protein
MSSIYIWQQAGTLCVIQGHFAILPVTITHNGSPLRATNPLPCSGERSRLHAVQSLGQLARTRHIQHSFLASILCNALPTADWDSPPNVRQRVQNITQLLCEVAYVRVADKSSVTLFAFCRQWAWDATKQFLTQDNYNPRPLDNGLHIMALLRRIITQNR